MTIESIGKPNVARGLSRQHFDTLKLVKLTAGVSSGATVGWLAHELAADEQAVRRYLHTLARRGEIHLYRRPLGDLIACAYELDSGVENGPWVRVYDYHHGSERTYVAHSLRPAAIRSE